MLESGWLFSGFVALIMTLLALVTQTQAVRMMGANADEIAMVTGAVGTIFWGAFAYGSLDVQATSSGVVIGFSMPVLTFSAIAVALVPAYVVLVGPAQILASRYEDMSAEEY